MRIAFLTPEFVTDYADGGGLGNYLHRMARLLVAKGHEVEVFVSSVQEPRVLDHGGIRVERVPYGTGVPARLALKAGRHVGVEGPLQYGLKAIALAAALERRHAEAPFALVQSADYQGVGLRVARREGRVHVIRCSCAIDLYNRIDGTAPRAARLQERLEFAALRRADRVYAPSRFVADHLRQKLGLEVGVIRPPLQQEVPQAAELPAGLPERYLLHFGQLIPRKGTYWLAKALRRAFEQEPGLRLVVVGSGDTRQLGAAFGALGPYRSRVCLLYPLPKPQLYAVLQRAEAAVLPSLVDNLPNTVIESLLFGIPVVGTAGASIDELVEPGTTGELAAPEDDEALAQAMVRIWRGESGARKGFRWQGALAQEMAPDVAAARLVALAQ